MPTYFRPCIDLHHGIVKQIVGSTLDKQEWNSENPSIHQKKNISNPSSTTICNFASNHSSSYFASKFKNDGLKGGHVIMLGQNQTNQKAAKEALMAFPKGLHIGGGMDIKSVQEWLDVGAQKVIVTSWLFNDTLNLSEERLRRISEFIGRQQFVVDLSCRPFITNDNAITKVQNPVDEEKGWVICLNGWATQSNCLLNEVTLDTVSTYASEILIHAVAQEGMCQGIDVQLIKFLGRWNQSSSCRIVYAGGINSMKCFEDIEYLSNGTIDATVGSALDIYGGHLIKYSDCIQWNLDREKDTRLL